MIFKAKVLNGILIFFDKYSYNIHLKNLEGKHVNVAVKLPSKQSSNSQRAWLFGVAYKIISEATGMTVEEVHNCEPIAKLRMDYTKEFPTPKSVAMISMDTKEFNEYKDKLQQWGAEHEYYIPDPNEGGEL